jgi:hypothetical protein
MFEKRQKRAFATPRRRIADTPGAPPPGVGSAAAQVVRRLL